METDSVIHFEMTCDGGVRSRVGSVSSQPQISSGNGVEMSALNGGGCRRFGREIYGKNGGDAVKNLDGRWNGVFVSSIRWPWSFELGCAEAGCGFSCSVSYEMNSRIGCGCGFDSCVASTTTESRTPHGHGHDHDHDHDCGYDCPESSWSWPRKSAPCSHDSEESSRPTRRVGAKTKVCLADCSLGYGLVSGAAALELSLWYGGGAERRSLSRDGPRGEEILVDPRTSLLCQIEAVLCNHNFLRRLSWQHVEGDAEAM
jgi:hypothetical protein